MTELRELRRSIGLTQREFAERLDVSASSCHMWESGLRPVSARMLALAREVVVRHGYETELLPLARLAAELDIHVRTLQAAVRTGRLKAKFSSKTVFGRPLRFATRAAAARFVATHYRRFAGQEECPVPLPTVPADYDQHLRSLRRRLRLSQAALAQRVGAAGKAVVYQWESRKRTPSPVFWQRVQDLLNSRGSSRGARSRESVRRDSLQYGRTL